MDKFFNQLSNQFRRIIHDDGRNDRDFTAQEEALRQSLVRLTQATQELARASERLNEAAVSVDPPEWGQMH